MSDTEAEALLNRIGTTPVTIRRRYELLQPFTKAFESVHAKNAIRNSRLDALERRLAALEAKPSVKYCGVWQRDATYDIGDAATHSGSLWICKSPTVGEPGHDYAGWQLAVKRGAAR